MRTKLTLMLAPLLVLCMAFSYGQEKTIKGNVTDHNGLALPGVSVVVVGTTSGTQTDFDGNYTIKANVGQTLRFSYVGQKTTDRKVGASNTVDVQMEEDAQALEEVVVVGYGSGKKLGSVVGSVVQVSADKLQDKPSANVLDAMQGKVAGVQIFSSSGEPSATPSIRLHGVGSLSGSSTPLFVMDGIPLSDGSLVSLNSNDFESVSILKDASATSIYGSRAANGVVFITTKKGKSGDSTINIKTQYGVSRLANTDFMESVMNREQFLDFMFERGAYSQATIDFINETYPGVDTQWYKEYYKDYAQSVQTDVSVSGGSDNGTYFISGSYFEQDGLAYQSDFKRYTLRSNLTSRVNNWMRMGLNLSLGYDIRQTNPSGANSTNRGLALLAQPFYSPTDENGEIWRDQPIPGWGRYHPKYREEKLLSKGNNLQLNPSGYITITPFEGATFKSQMGLELYDYRVSGTNLPSYAGIADGSASERFDRAVTQTVTNTLEYKFNINEDHAISALVGQEYVKYEYERFDAGSGGQTDDRLILLPAGITDTRRTVGQSKSEYVFDSYFGRLEYNYAGKYFLDGSVRRDGSSRFGEENRYANFWSAGAMWKLKREAFLEDVNWINDLNLKVSTGTSGNSSGIGNYQALPTVGNGQYDGSISFGLSAPGNSALTWESQNKTTIGLNAALFNRINLDLEYYIRTTEDMLVSVPVPLTTGWSDITSNVGSLENKGIDVALSFDIFNAVNSGDLQVTPYINVNYNQNKVTELFQGRDQWIIPNTGVAWALDQPLSYFYPVFHGINSDTGAPEWYVPNADLDDRVNSNFDENNVTSDFVTADLQQNTGKDRYPPFNGGFGLNASWKGFSLQADFAFSQGKYLINNDRYFFENPTTFSGFNTSQRSADYWKNPGDETLFPSLAYQFTQFDSRLIEDASFLRMKNISLGYSIPKEVLDKVGFVKGARFFIVGRNLLTWTKYLGPDPEVDSNIGLGTNPNTKQLTFGVDIKL